MKTFSTLALFAITATTSFAGAEYPFTCRANLEYRNGNEIKNVPATVQGVRSEKNTIVGGVFVQAGALKFILNLPSGMVSENVIQIKGTSVKDQASLNLQYTVNSEGVENPESTMTIIVQRDGNLTTASNIMISDETLPKSQVSCDIAK